MNLLLDESVPLRLATCFPDEFEVHTVQQMGWAGSENGALLLQAVTRGFDALITTDRGIEHQQNQSKLPIAIVVMSVFPMRFQELQPLVERVVEVVKGDLQKRVYHVKG